MQVTASPANAGFVPQLSQAQRPGMLEMHSTRSLQASMQAATEISIMTDEGDRVTLSAAVARSLQIDDSMAFAAGEDGLKAKLEHSERRESSAEFGIEVEGDLNARELKDINRLMRALRKIVGKFFSGDTEGAMKGAIKAAGKMDKLDSLSGFDLTASMQMRVTETRTASATLSAPEPATPDDALQAPSLQAAIADIDAPAQPASPQTVSPPQAAVVSAPSAPAEMPAAMASAPTAAPVEQPVDQSVVADDAEHPALDAAVVDLRNLLSSGEFSAPKMRDLVPALILDSIAQFRDAIEAADDNEKRLNRLEDRLLKSLRDLPASGMDYQVQFSREVTETQAFSMSIYA